MRRTRKKSLIMAVARPKYPADKVSISLDPLEKGSRGAQVKALQILLIGLGHSCGKSGADGVFGSGTLTAAKAFQKAKGLTADGIVGKKTWSVLLGA
jgi:peptidoglycan hydrolase-like protein with peptidoglycan-binding domain